MTRNTMLVALLTVGWTPVGYAHPVTVDGSTADWLPRAASQENVGIVARGGAQQGELVWRDRPGDARTDLAPSPPYEEVGDLQLLGITGDDTNLYVYVTHRGDLDPGAPEPPAQIQIAIDLDRVAGSGQPDLWLGNTSVAADARWEYLLRTDFGRGPSVVVMDSVGATTFLPLSLSGATTEMAVPWSSLGLTGPPPVMRVTVAILRQDPFGVPVDVGDPSNSRVLDAVTDYGDPQSSGSYPNTWAEVSDGVIDYHFDVWFEPDGDVYAPLSISRFEAVDSPADAHWIEVRNQTGQSMDLSEYFLGNSPAPDFGGFMGSFPAATLLAGESFVVAESGASYSAAYGVYPDAEFEDSGPSTPDLVPFTNWATGPFSMIPSRGELLTLGPDHVTLDVVTYGLGFYTGIGAAPGPPPDRVLVRHPVSQDTDDNAVDFMLVRDCTTAGGCVSVCRVCERFACVFAPVGASCEDGDLCTTGTTCDTAAGCVGGSAVSCGDSNECTIDSCDAATGCSNTADTGAGCDDADMCTTGEVCSSAGVCGGGGAVACDDLNPCTNDSCEAATGCVNTPDTGAICDDGDMCTTGEVCSSAGLCGGGSSVSCDDLNPCTSDSCDAASGCSSVPNVGAVCDDGDPRTVGDACDSAGACEPGSPNPACGDAGGAPDAGTPDGGPPPIDAGSRRDAGFDGGGLDGGGFDDGGVDDGGSDGGAGTVEGGGCSCRALPSGLGDTPRVRLLGLLLALLLVSRRRRR